MSQRPGEGIQELCSEGHAGWPPAPNRGPRDHPVLLTAMPIDCCSWEALAPGAAQASGCSPRPPKEKALKDPRGQEHWHLVDKAGDIRREVMQAVPRRSQDRARDRAWLQFPSVWAP